MAKTPPRPAPKPAPRPAPAPPPPAPAPAPAPPPAPVGPTQAQQSALDLLSATLRSWGLDALIPDLTGLIQKGVTSTDSLALALSQTDAYKQRFAGNAERIAKGLPELTPAQYIATEEQYRNILQSYGLPTGFYDQHSDFNDFIGNDVSPTELASRAQVAHDQYTAAPPETRALWEQYYGSKGDAIAAILDPNVATQLIQDRGQQVALGGAAAQYGFGIGQQRAQQFQQAGVTLDKARNAYQQISQSYGTDQQIAQRFGTKFDQADEENSLILGQGAAQQQRATLYNEEQSLFRGKSGFDSQALGVSQSF